MDLVVGYSNPLYDGRKVIDEFLLGPNGDLQFDYLGQIRTVVDESKLVQQIGKILLTEQGENIFEARYGTILHSFIGAPVYEDTTYGLLKQTILDAIGLFIALQQDITNEHEKIATVESIGTAFNEDNTNCSISVYLSVTNEAAKEVTASISIPYTG